VAHLLAMFWCRLRLWTCIIVGTLMTAIVLYSFSSADTGAAAPVVTQPRAATSSTRPAESFTLAHQIYLPAIGRLSCPASAEIASPFAVEIAALHEVAEADDGSRLLRPTSEEGWLALYDEPFPTLLDALRDSGAGWARVRINWSWIQPEPPPADYVWGPYHDEKLRLVAETGVRLIATVTDAPAWAADLPCKPIYPDRLDEFTQFLTDLVERYAQLPYHIKHWELINEPDGTWSEGWVSGLGCWAVAGGQEDGGQYAQMLAAAYGAIKGADPEATVLMGGVAHDWFTEYGGPFDRYFPDEVMAFGGGAAADMLSFHYFPDFHAEWERWDPASQDRRYGVLPVPTCGDLFDGEGQAYEAGGIDLIAKATHFRNRMRTCYGVDKPVWVTELAEHGYANNPTSLAGQARYVIEGYVRGLAAGVENITWYALATPNDSFEQGLLYDDWTPKPAVYAYRTLTAELAGYTYARTLDVSGGEGYVFQNPCRQEKTVAWGSAVWSFGPAQRLRVVDRWGNVSFVYDGGDGDSDGTVDGSVALQLSVDPVFVSVG
jgi:hypothetical protein